MKSFLEEYGITTVVAVVVTALIGTATVFGSTGGESVKGFMNNFLCEAQIVSSDEEIPVITGETIYDEEILGGIYENCTLYNCSSLNATYRNCSLINCTLICSNLENCNISGDNTGANECTFSGCKISGGTYGFDPSSMLESGYSVVCLNANDGIYRVVKSNPPLPGDDNLIN